MPKCPCSVGMLLYNSTGNPINYDLLSFFVLLSEEKRQDYFLFDFLDLAQFRFHNLKELEQLIEVLLPRASYVQCSLSQSIEYFQTFTHFLPFLIFICLFPSLKFLFQQLRIEFLLNFLSLLRRHRYLDVSLRMWMYNTLKTTFICCTYYSGECFREMSVVSKYSSTHSSNQRWFSL